MLKRLVYCRNILKRAANLIVVRLYKYNDLFLFLRTVKHVRRLWIFICQLRDLRYWNQRYIYGPQICLFGEAEDHEQKLLLVFFWAITELRKGSKILKKVFSWSRRLINPT